MDPHAAVGLASDNVKSMTPEYQRYLAAIIILPIVFWIGSVIFAFWIGKKAGVQKQKAAHGEKRDRVCCCL